MLIWYSLKKYIKNLKNEFIREYLEDIDASLQSRILC